MTDGLSINLDVSNDPTRAAENDALEVTLIGDMQQDDIRVIYYYFHA
jgi:hypothetical protein